MKESIGMYADTTTWNPFKGCLFDCVYCEPSFKRQAKRQKRNCIKCYNYMPHCHPERLTRIPNSNIVFVCGNGDVSFCKPKFTLEIINAIKKKNVTHADITYYFQSKNPTYFKQFLNEFPSNVILLITLETNRNKGYRLISKAPLPRKRYNDFLTLDYPRKVVTVEPVLDFDLDIFSGWLLNINPEYVWLGFNSKPKAVQLPEPNIENFRKLIAVLESNGLEIKLKDARTIDLVK